MILRVWKNFINEITPPRRSLVFTRRVKDIYSGRKYDSCRILNIELSGQSRATLGIRQIVIIVDRWPRWMVRFTKDYVTKIVWITVCRNRNVLCTKVIVDFPFITMFQKHLAIRKVMIYEFLWNPLIFIILLVFANTSKNIFFSQWI